MNLNLQIDPVTAVHVAEFLEQRQLTDSANRLWRALSDATTWDRAIREEMAATMFAAREGQFPIGSVGRGQFILYAMALSLPSTLLVEAYFENLQEYLRPYPRLDRPGQLVLGAGTGRCGSTTLAAAFRDRPGYCGTHENPPFVHWTPSADQVEFHLRRFKLLSQYFRLVFDAAHWWLNLHARIFAEFPESKLVGLVRETDHCVASILKFQGRGPGSYNYYAAPHNGLWRPGLWDPTYPSYAAPPGVLPGSDEAFAAKRAMIVQYVTDYNRELAALADRQPDRVLLVRTETLDAPETSRQLSEFAGRQITMPPAKNVGNNVEGARPEFWF